MSKIKLIALDMDGTLLNDEGHITDYTKTTIKKVLNKGVEVVLCTGRPFSLCHPYGEELGLSSYLIVSNGAEIWNMEQKLIERQTMDPVLMQKLWSIGDEVDTHMWFVTTDDVFHKDNRPHDFTKYDWLKMGYGDLTEDTKKLIMNELSQISNQLEITNSFPTNIEVNQVGINKAEAIKAICQRESLSMDEVMVVGDGGNDLKMIQQAGIGVAMGNAQGMIKAAADFTTVTNNEHGVAKAIEQFIL